MDNIRKNYQGKATMRRDTSGKKKGISHNIKGAHVILFTLLRILTKDKKGNYKEDAIQAILLCKRTQDALIHPGYWALFGGRCDGKQPQATIRMEIKEELEITGINPEKFRMKKICDILIRRKKGSSLIRYYKMPLDVGVHKLKLKWNKDEKKVEGEGIGWFTAEEINHMMIRPEDRLAIGEFFRKNGI